MFSEIFASAAAWAFMPMMEEENNPNEFGIAPT